MHIYTLTLEKVALAFSPGTVVVTSAKMEKLSLAIIDGLCGVQNNLN